MSGETDLGVLLAGLSPRLNDGCWVYTQVSSVIPAGAHPVVVVQEDEGLTLVIAQPEADALGLAYEFVAAWITLQVESSLEAVGLTAAVSRALGDAGISANVVAGHTHDHVFVPHVLADEAMRALTELAAASTPPPTSASSTRTPRAPAATDNGRDG